MIDGGELEELSPIKVSVVPDEKGFYDRQCPNPECEFIFKIKLDDWTEKVSNEVVYCPQCGYSSKSDDWNTEFQIERIQEIAVSAVMGWIHDELSNTMKTLERETRSNKYCKVTYKPGRRPELLDLPIEQLPNWETEYTCPKCGVTISTIGNIHFCPCCGLVLSIDTYLDTLATKERQLNSLSEIEDSCRPTLGEDGARKIRTQIEESTLVELVSGFQSFAEQLYLSVANTKPKKNLFQRIKNGSEAFESLIGVSYETIIGDDIRFMQLMFQRRHLLEHKNGIVDEDYLRKAGDANARLGQRIIVRDSDLIDFIKVLRTLAEGLIRALQIDYS